MCGKLLFPETLTGSFTFIFFHLFSLVIGWETFGAAPNVFPRMDPGTKPRGGSGLLLLLFSSSKIPSFSRTLIQHSLLQTLLFAESRDIIWPLAGKPGLGHGFIGC